MTRAHFFYQWKVCFNGAIASAKFICTYIRTYLCCSQLCDGIFVWGTPICRFKNKSAYVQLTLKSMVAKEMELHKHLRVTVDGEELKLPALEGLVLLNIQSWAAGADPMGHHRRS